MDTNTKYKRWGWGAIAGLIGVILIAGLVVAVTMSSPKPNTELAANNTDSSVSDQIEAGENSSNNAGDANSNNDSQSEEEKAAQEKAEAEAKAEEDAKKNEAANSTDKTADSDTKKLPKTGPADSMMAIVAFAVIAGLVSYNISLKKQA